MKQTFIARLHNMEQSELADMIPRDTLNRIKRKDKKPEFRAYVLGHEGEAHPERVGGGKMKFKYLKDAVINLGNKIKDGIKAFVGHGETNSHDSRTPVGEVVGKGFKWIEGRLAAVATMYMYPEHRDKSLDVASIETEVEYALDDSGYAHVRKFNDITGIALGDSRVDTPAFSGATLLASLQAFQSSEGEFTHQKGGTMTLDEIKQAIQEGRFSPSQVFDVADLQADKAVIGHVKKEKQTEYEHARRVQEQLGKEREERRKAEKEYEDKLKEATQQLLSGKTEAVLSKVVDDRELDEKQLAWVKRNLKSFETKAENEDEMKTDLNKFIDGQIQEYDETAKLFGVTKEEKGKDRGLADDETIDESSEEAYEDPKENELIPQTDGGK